MAKIEVQFALEEYRIVVDGSDTPFSEYDTPSVVEKSGVVYIACAPDGDGEYPVWAWKDGELTDVSLDSSAYSDVQIESTEDVTEVDIEEEEEEEAAS